MPLTLEARSSAGFSEDELTEAIEGRSETVRAVPRGPGVELEEASGIRKADRPCRCSTSADAFGAALALLPAESYVEFQLAAQKLRPESLVLVAGYGECGPGYIPIERAWKENDGNLSDWCWVNPGSEKRMMDALEKMLS